MNSKEEGSKTRFTNNNKKKRIRSRLLTEIARKDHWYIFSSSPEGPLQKCSWNSSQCFADGEDDLKRLVT